MYLYKTSLKLRDTDASGAVYFANVFSLAQEAFESYLDAKGLNIGTLMRNKPYHCPVVNAEANYLKPMGPGQPLHIEVTCERLGKTSFTISYRILSSDGEAFSNVRVTHVVVDRATGTKQPLPDEVVNGLHPISHGAADAPTA